MQAKKNFSDFPSLSLFEVYYVNIRIYFQSWSRPLLMGNKQTPECMKFKNSLNKLKHRARCNLCTHICIIIRLYPFCMNCVSKSNHFGCKSQYTIDGHSIPGGDICPFQLSYNCRCYLLIFIDLVLKNDHLMFSS